jgi:uncharacterized membrane protein
MTTPPEAVATALLLLPLLGGGLLLLVWPSPPQTLKLSSGSVLVLSGGRWRSAAVRDVGYCDRVRYRGADYTVVRWERPDRFGPVTLTLQRC